MNQRVFRGCQWLMLILFCVTTQAAEDIVTFDDPAQGRLYYALLEEYRCLKCQNQNLADSNASLAGDLRREIREQILEGKSKQDIDDYLVARYGEFVLYRPRFNAKTAVLWIAPFVILLIGLGSLVVMVRRRNQMPGRVALETDASTHDSDASSTRSALLSDEEKQRLEKARRLLR